MWEREKVLIYLLKNLGFLIGQKHQVLLLYCKSVLIYWQSKNGKLNNWKDVTVSDALTVAAAASMGIPPLAFALNLAAAGLNARAAVLGEKEPMPTLGDLFGGTSDAVQDFFDGKIDINYDYLGGFLSEKIDDFFHWCFNFLPSDWNSWFKLPYRNQTGIRQVDPLALDLDGDGIETVAAKGYDGSLFDHRGTGIRTAGGWVAPDDGLLALDLNNNGVSTTAASCSTTVPVCPTAVPPPTATKLCASTIKTSTTKSTPKTPSITPCAYGATSTRTASARKANFSA